MRMPKSSSSARAILLGIAAIIVANFAISMAVVPIMLHFGEWSFDANPTDESILESLPWPVLVGGPILSFLTFAFGGYLTARFSESRAIAHALIAAVISAAVLGLSSLYEGETDLLILGAITVVSIAGAVFGGYIVQRSRPRVGTI